MNVLTKIKKWGSSASIRIPDEVMSASHLKLDDVVNIRVQDHRIIIERVHQKYQLDLLLEQINEKNLHDEVDFGEAVGNEKW